MKQFLSNFLHFFFDSPVLPVMTVICAFSVFFLTADAFLQPEETVPDYTITMSAFSLGEFAAETTACTSAANTSSASVKTEKTTESTETTPADEYYEDQPQQPFHDYGSLSVGESPNSGFYQDRLTIIGDSIAYGFNAYGYIPDQHNIAQESLAVWNMGNYSFDLGGGSMGLVDAAAYANSSLYYISIGMNDVFSFTPGDYAWNIRWIAEDVLDRVPDATIVVGTITPVSADNYYTTNDIIDEFNAALEAVIYDLGSSHVLFFDANYILKDLSAGALDYEYSGGDGLHLNSSAYSHVLRCLFNFLDLTGAINQIN